MKHAADGLKYSLKWALFAWSQDPISPNLGDLTEWILFLLQILTCLDGQTFSGEWDEITHQELSVYLEISQNSQENTWARVSFSFKLQSSATLLKKRLWLRCFLVNFVKFLRTPFFIEHLWWLLL